MDLLHDPWIDVLSVDGPATLNLTEVADHLGDIIDVVSDDPLVDAAILRLLMAADLVSGGDIGRWLRDTAGQWCLFDRQRPFWQNPMLADVVDQAGTLVSAVALSYRHAGNGNVLLDHRHNESATLVSPAEAARSLVMRQQFSTMGIQSFPERIFGVKSATAAVAEARPLVWIDAGNLAETLAANRCPGPVGRFHFTWPAGQVPGSIMDPGGQADALTWQSRSILLLPDADGNVQWISVTDGVRYEPGVGPDPQRLPHTLFRPIRAGSNTGDEPSGQQRYGLVEVKMSRPVWRQLLSEWTVSTAPGIIAHARTTRGDARLRMTGLASRQARIDGVQTGQLESLRLSAAEAAELDSAITAAGQKVRRAAAAATKVATPAVPGWAAHLVPAQEQLDADTEPIVARALTREISIAEAVEQIYDTARTFIPGIAAMLGASNPMAAATAAEALR